MTAPRCKAWLTKTAVSWGLLNAGLIPRPCWNGPWRFFLHTISTANSWLATLAGDCTYQAVDDMNRQIVNPILTDLVTTAFFKYFKVRRHGSVNRVSSALGDGVRD